MALDEDPATAPTVAARTDPSAPTELAAAPATGESGDPAASPEALVGTAERYRYMGTLGEGGMGLVEKVWDDDLMRALALKRLKPDLRSDRALLRQFLWEARVGAHLDHPNIVPVHDIGLSQRGELYFTMKHVEGESLAEALERLRTDGDEVTQELSLPRRLRLFLSLCAAVHFAHARGVLHRDLKPANVMLGKHGEVFVMDWGIAVPARDRAPEMLVAAAPDQATRGVTGTPAYMAPEQAAGDPIDPRSDVYALGAILYELVSLAPPIEGATVSEILDKALRGDIVPLPEVAPEAGPSLTAVVHRALAKDPGDRYPSVQDLSQDVEVVLDGRTPSAESTNLAKRFGRYYLTTDRARLRPFDLDLLIGSGIAMGFAGGIWLADTLAGLSWAFLVLAALIGIPPFLQWFRGTSRRA
jgi:serine/threonine-protein kinase